jgi:hypothetical protein
MTWQDFLMTFTSFVSVIELFYLIRIFIDDHKMEKLAEESLEVQKQSLEAQKEYLALRRKWYASRAEKKGKNDVERTAGLVDGNSPNAG